MKRNSIVEYFQKEIYGYIPDAPKKVSGEIIEENPIFCAGKATLQTIKITAVYRGQAVYFPVRYCYPNNNRPNKTVVLLNFTGGVPDKYLPAEEIIDRGWAFVSLYYEEATKDNSDFQDGIAKVLKGEGDSAPGKIAMWAWAAMRTMDYLQTLDSVDKKNVAIVGHSRLGKTALVAAAFDNRFAFVHSNDSGTCGTALFAMENEKSEHIKDILGEFSQWFCESFKKYEGKEREMPYDQDELLKLIAPRTLSIGSAIEDFWANPAAECASAVRASQKWEEMGYKGLNVPERAEVGVNYHDGKVGYYVRKGRHYLSREDWDRLLSFFDKNING